MSRWLLLVAGLVACAEPGNARPVVYMLAPRALQPVIDPVVAHWELEQSAEVRVGYDTPDRLQRQADGGTRADVFVAADRRWMDALQDDGHVAPFDRQALAFDPLVFVSRLPQSPVRDPSWLVDHPKLGGGVGLVSGDLPEGIVAQQALQDAQVWTAIESRVVRFSTGRALSAALEDGDVVVGVCRRSSVMAAFDTLATHPFGPEQRFGSVIEVAALQRGDTPVSAYSPSLIASLSDGPGVRESWMQAGLVKGVSRPEDRTHVDPAAGLLVPPRGASPGPPRGPSTRPHPKLPQGAAPPATGALPEAQHPSAAPRQGNPGRAPRQASGSPAR